MAPVNDNKGVIADNHSNYRLTGWKYPSYEMKIPIP